MKKIIFSILLTVLSQSIFSQVDSNLECHNEIINHLNIVETSNSIFKNLKEKKNTELSAYDVSTFEHYFLTRFLHLQTLKNTQCEKESIRKLVIQSDMIELSKYVFSDFKLRRIVSFLKNYRKEELKDFKKTYNFNLRKSTLSQNLELLENESMRDTAEKLPLLLELDDINRRYTISDISLNALSATVASAAYLWGKLSDKTVWREGRLKENEEAFQLVLKNLRPFDLIYESRNYTLSHFTIPGHFGHVAIWLGTKEQLIEMGIWDKEFLAPFRAEIEKGNNILEVRKPGVQFVSLKTFINLDEIAVTRITDIEKSSEEIFVNLKKQFGKKYDFKFNAHSSNKITCTELVAFSFGDIDWPMIKKAGIVNLRPDDLAILGIDSPFKSSFILFLEGNKDKSFSTHTEEEFYKLFK